MTPPALFAVFDPLEQLEQLAQTIWLNPTWLADKATVWAIPVWEGALAFGALVVFCTLLRLALPKTYAVTLTTAKEAVYQPLFYLLVGSGAFLLIIFAWMPYYTFGEDVKMVKDAGLTLLMIMSIILALWTASASISDEIEGRTALTVLSKPISRSQFILGKFLGICVPVALLFIILGVVFMYVIAYKIGYDGRESGTPVIDEAKRLQDTVQVIPGLVLAFFESVVLTSISVAISTRLPMLPNLLICSMVYVLGHLAPMMVEAGVTKNELVSFVAQFMATIFPNLDSFNIYAAVATGNTVPLSYVVTAAMYCLLYSSMVMCVALLMFEDRDLA